MRVPHGHVDRHVLRRQTRIEPGQRGCDTGTLVAQPVQQLNREWFREACGPTVAEQRWERRGWACTGAQQTVGEIVRALSCHTIVHDLLGDTPKILDQHDPQGDRNRPQLADRQELHLLVGPHVALQHLCVEAAVGMRDEGPGHAEHPWVPSERPGGELG